VRTVTRESNVMTPQCHVTIPLKIKMIFLDLPRLNVS